MERDDSPEEQQNVPPTTNNNPPPYVIFQIGEGSNENLVFNLPSVLAQQQNDTSNTANRYSDLADIQRNMVVQVSYVYNQTQVAPQAQRNDSNGPPSSGQGTATNNNNQQDPQPRRGTIVLNVPDFPSNRSDGQINAMIEFATSLALSTIAANGFTGATKSIKKETFEKFPVLKRNEVHDSNCAICFEEFTFPKRTLASEMNDSMINLHKNLKTKGENGPNIKRRRLDYISGSTSSEGNSASETRGVQEPSIRNDEQSQQEHQQESNWDNSTTRQSSNEESEEVEYGHEPLELPCKHVFGRSCIYEWLKKNNSCPLCRTVIHDDSEAPGVPESINVPNIANLLNPGTRERPTVIYLDRNTNTLTTRESAENRTPSENLRSLRGFVNQPSATAPRNQEVRDLLGSLDSSASNMGSMFAMGVASRRTRDGVETVNLDNNRNEFSDTDLFSADRRRFIRSRLIERLNQRNENSQRRSNLETGDTESSPRDQQNNDRRDITAAEDESRETIERNESRNSGNADNSTREDAEPENDNRDSGQTT
ncbi:hypothetical protein WICMUC_003503 [Wickerhamomyces mucosus]|uniref:RING-type domain-containing protein n=1 Tax=Wickerhamomyces mucosus TaxID=1378264 RepID=A0A9P8PKU6_9ASCO|nr:hypothetical protein WICMUC_003503 [Wickerhamomyces mucosus]